MPKTTEDFIPARCHAIKRTACLCAIAILAPWTGNQLVTGAETVTARPASEEHEPKQNAAVDARVGVLGNVQNINFDGAKTFLVEDLRLALSAPPNFLEISHPFALLADYLAAIETRIRLGYLHNGFPQPKISVRHDSQA